MEVYSFTSSKNTNVSSVQFVIKTSEIKKEEVKEDKKDYLLIKAEDILAVIE